MYALKGYLSRENARAQRLEQEIRIRKKAPPARWNILSGLIKKRFSNRLVYYLAPGQRSGMMDEFQM
jgi:hypothetical protein